MKDFYVYLPSNTDFLHENKASRYVTKLAKELTLGSDWECCLTLSLRNYFLGLTELKYVIFNYVLVILLSFSYYFRYNCPSYII